MHPSPPRSFRNLALIGFMGVGKSTVGHLLSEMLHFEMIDTDRVIEQKAGKRITEIFAQDGESAFRRMEKDVVAELAQVQDKIIATGGGLVTHSDNLESLKAHSLTVCLWATPEVIFERVRHQQHRPLLNLPDPLGRIRELLVQRTPHYRGADMMVGVDFRHVTEIARHIAKSFLDVRARHSTDSPPRP